jgi:hypothetical protein
MDQTIALLLAGLVILVCLASGLSLRTVPRASAVALAAVLLMPAALGFAGPDDTGSFTAAAVYLCPLVGIAAGAFTMAVYLSVRRTPRLRA